LQKTANSKSEVWQRENESITGMAATVNPTEEELDRPCERWGK